jgi:hypothetical protein
MGRGGKRTGAGAKKGKPQPRTVERIELQRQFREAAAKRFGDVVQAQLALALGIDHLVARERDGKWTRVTDPDVMVTVLNSGESFYRIFAQNPDPRALKDILDRVLGSPTQAVEISGPEGQPLGDQSDAVLKARIAALFNKL